MVKYVGMRIPPVWVYVLLDNCYNLTTKEKYKTKQKRDRLVGVQENNYVYLTTGRDMHLLTRKRKCFNFVQPSYAYPYVSWPIFKYVFIVPRVYSFFLVPTIPQCTDHGRQLPYYPSGGITLIFFHWVWSLTIKHWLLKFKGLKFCYKFHVNEDYNFCDY